jgi:hypothetical protein
MDITAPWRQIGTIPLDAWKAEFRAKDSPLLASVDDIYREAGEHGALALAMAWVETQYGTVGRTVPAKNAHNLRPGPGFMEPTIALPDKGLFLVFEEWAESFAEWRRRLFDEADTYKGGIYARIGPTLFDLVNDAYAPPGPEGSPESENRPILYAQSLARELTRLNAPILDEDGEEEPPMAELTFGRVPHPAVTDRYIPDFQNMAWDNLGQRIVRGVVWHRMVGNLWGTDGYFRTFGNAQVTKKGGLTDYGVGVAAADGAAQDGVILRWNDPHGKERAVVVNGVPRKVSANRAGWASGPYSASGSFGDGKAFVQEFGVSAINRDQVSIEISGQYTTPLSAKSRQAIAQLTAYYADQARIPWNEFPIWPGHNYSFVRWHVEYCGEAHKPCPGKVVRDETNELIRMVKEILRQYQTAAAPPTYVSVKPIPQLYPWDGKDRTVNTLTFFACQREIKITKETKVWQYATTTGGQVHAPLPAGSLIKMDYTFKDEGGKQWLYTPEHWRIAVEDNITPIPSFTV